MSELVCKWCGETFTVPSGPGPTPKYCRPSHRQRAYEARRAVVTTQDDDASAPAASPMAGGRRRVAVNVLGEVNILAADGRRLALTPELRGVVSLLALRPRQVVSVEELIDALWPGIDDRAARHRLQTAVWRLRTLTAAEGEDRLLRWSVPGYVLDVSDDQLDWKRFQRLADAGGRALRTADVVRFAMSYLTAALSLWEQPGVLVGVDLPSDALPFVTRLAALRDEAVGLLIEAAFRLEEYDDVVPMLQARYGTEPTDERTAWQLAVAYHRTGKTDRALETCNEYLRRRPHEAATQRSRVADLASAILQRGPEPDDRWWRTESASVSSQRNGARSDAVLAAVWDRYHPAAAGPLPAELHVLVEERGGSLHEATETSVHAAFATVRSALDAAMELQRAVGAPMIATGVEVAAAGAGGATTPELLQARSRLLANAAKPGQILISGIAVEDDIRNVAQPDANLEPLGSHRLNALTTPALVYGIAVHGPSLSRAPPAWFDEGALHNLADEPFGFFGRSDDVRKIATQLAAANITTLVGPPGTGKTRLAAHVARRVARDYPDGAWFVPLASVSDPAHVAATVAEALRLPRPAVATLDTLSRTMRDKQLLVLLDNCEHLVGACRQVAESLITGCPLVTVLATSREALHSRLERVVTVSPLPLPPTSPPEAVAQNPSVQLLQDRAGQQLDSATAARICRTVDGIPLAIVLAAAAVADLGAGVLADLLADAMGGGRGLRLLGETAAESSAEHGTLHEAIAWSYRLLPEQTRELFDATAVFRAEFDLEDAVAVAGGLGGSHEAVIDGIRRLVQASMVAHDVTSDRYRLLQPLRDFAAGNLATRSGDGAAVRRRHMEHYVAKAALLDPRRTAPQDPTTLDRVDEVLPDLYGAMESALTHKAAVAAQQLVTCLWSFWLLRGRILEGRDFAEKALALDREPSVTRASALTACSHLAWFSGDMDRSRAACRETFEIAELTGDRWSWAWAVLGLAAVDMFKGGDDGVPERINEALPTFRALGNHWDTGQALQTLSGAAWHRGDYDRARRAMAEAQAIARSRGHPPLLATLFGHGLMTALLGDLDAGAQEVDQAIAAAYQAGGLVHLAIAVCHRAAIARYAGEHDAARRYYREALRAAHTAGQGWALLWALNGLASTDGIEDPRRLEACVELLMCADTLADHMGINLAPPERDAHHRDLERARERLSADVFHGAARRGAHLPIDDAIDLALSLDEA